MPTVGPSKEELKNYFENNRQYFDELAKYYRESDPVYYKENIAPFYNGLLITSGSKKSAKGCLAVAMSIAILIIGLAAGLVFFILQQEESDDKQTIPQIQKEEKVIPKSDSIKVKPENKNKRKKKKE
jgi:ATP-dependent Zn protease